MLLRGCQLIEWVLPVMAGSSAVVKVHFEVFGKVQGKERLNDQFYNDNNRSILS